MPLPLLLAMVVAFGLGLPTDPRPMAGQELARRLMEVGGGVLAVGVLGWIVGRVVAARSGRGQGSGSRARSLYLWGLRLIVALGLAVFAWTVVIVEWPRVVDRGLGLRGVMLVEEMAVLLPYLAGQFLAWCGLYRAESALRPASDGAGLGNYLLRKSRMSLGMVLPVAMIYVLGRDVLRWGFPAAAVDPIVQFGATCFVAMLVFVISPAFVRLTWPTRRLEDGHLRDRLERLARRLKFRCTDLRVWDTGGGVVNAGVTGAVPWFRYVLITDAMIEMLDEREIEAVFGHEVGHVAHRHLPYFAAFFLGSAALMALVDSLSQSMGLDIFLERRIADPSIVNVVHASVIFAVWGVFFFLVFGHLSRRFERQADVYGARAVSCGRDDCPPHLDLNAPGSAYASPPSLCPMGLRIFADALANVAVLNGMSPGARSWRHGSIARRIAFLESLENRPDAARRFERGVRRLRWGLGLGLALMVAAAIFGEFGY